MYKLIDRKKIIAVIDTTFAVVKRKPEKNQACTGFEPVTSAILPWCQRFYFLSGEAANLRFVSGEATTARRRGKNKTSGHSSSRPHFHGRDQYKICTRSLIGYSYSFPDSAGS